jgi:hypothetical protein
MYNATYQPGMEAVVMETGSIRGILAILLSAVIALTGMSACTPNYTANYAKDKGLPKEVRSILSQLPYDEATVKLMDDVAALPKTLQIHQSTLDYLKRISADKNISWDEVSGLGELDSDNDRLKNKKESELGTDPLIPDPSVVYALDKGLSDPKYIEPIKQMDEKTGSNDNILKSENKAVIDIAAELLKVTGISNHARKSSIVMALTKPAEFRSVYNSLKSISDKVLNEYLGFGIDEKILNYVSFVSGLPDKNFAKYALEKKLS